MMDDLFNNTKWNQIRKNMGLAPMARMKRYTRPSTSQSKASSTQTKKKISAKSYRIPDKIRKRIGALVVKGDLRKIFDLLHDHFLQVGKSTNEITMLKSKYTALKQKQIKGTINEEDHDVELNKMKDQILELLKLY